MEARAAVAWPVAFQMQTVQLFSCKGCASEETHPEAFRREGLHLEPVCLFRSLQCQLRQHMFREEAFRLFHTTWSSGANNVTIPAPSFQSKLTHTRAKALFSCTQCNYSYMQSDNLKSHLRTHSGEKPFRCEHCIYSCTHAHVLKEHKHPHTGEKPHKCD